MASRLPIPSNLVVDPGKFSLLALLPAELHLHIISYLDVKDVIRLRQTCRHYYHYFTRGNITKHFSVDGQPTIELLSCCVNCFKVSDCVLVLDEVRWQSPWRSMCSRCFRVERSPAYSDRRKFTDITFADGGHGHVCSYCGWPVYRERMHRSCYIYADDSLGCFLHKKWQDMLNVAIIIPLLTTVCYRVMPTSILPPGLGFIMYLSPVVSFFKHILRTSVASRFAMTGANG
ncbi:hypothetical protein F4814DRAFT_459500 [Daldinia grandis]|nr:hypothetical protein F4814DRAFT_459500 [Daldinia grandis]